METTQILTAIAVIFIYIIWYRFSKKCPSCYHWNSLKKINSQLSRTETRTRIKTVYDTHKDSNNRVIKTVEKQVPVTDTVNYYNVTYECKNCKKQIIKELSSGSYLKEIFVFFMLIFIILIGFNSNKNKSVNINKNVISNQNNNTDTLSDYSKTNSPKVNDFSPKNSSTGDTKSENSDLSSKAASNGDAESGNSASQPKELEIESPNEKQNNAQVISKQTVITAESPEYLKRELAFEMLKRGKDVDEIADSTYLSKSQIRKLRRNIKKE